MTIYKTIEFTVDGPTARIAFDRPHARNSLTNLSTVEFHDALNRVATNRSVRVLVVTGNGNDFCPGADVKGFAAGDDEASEADGMGADVFQATRILHEMPAVTIAAIRGGCAGAGFGWACACDLRVADTSARFNTAFLAVGVAGDMAVPWLLPRIIGAGRARELSFFPQKFDADEAKAMGLVNRVFAPEEYEAGVAAMVDQLGRGSAPDALRALKSNYVEAERMPLGSYITLETERHLALFDSPDREEAFAAFVEKRAPRYDR